MSPPTSRLAVVLHVGTDQMIGRQGSHKGQFTGKHRRRHDLGEFAGIVSGGAVGTFGGATDTTNLQTTRLRWLLYGWVS